LNPTAPILRCKYSDINPKELLNIGAFDLSRALVVDPMFLDENQEHQHDSTVTSVAFKYNIDVNTELLYSWIERLVADMGPTLYRYKGVISVKGKDEKFVFQGVGAFCEGVFGELWKDHEQRESRFVFIGKNLDTELLTSGFEACLVTKDLRFNVGDTVLANCEDEFIQGKVVKQWDDGNAYLVELDDGDEVWAPVDIDHYIRAI
jgi:G3E family GTPase